MSSRVETLLKAALSDDDIVIFKPQSRLERQLCKCLGHDVDVQEPQSRIETLFNEVTEISSGEALLTNAQFTSNFQNTYKNENHNEYYQLEFRSSALTEPIYCENGLDHIAGGYCFDYSSQWKNEFLNYNENTIIATVKIAGNVADNNYTAQRLFDFFPTNTKASCVGFSDGNLYKIINQGGTSNPSTKTPMDINKWYVVSVVFKSGKYYVYLDDTLVSTSIIVNKENQDSLWNARFLNSRDGAKLNGYIRNLTYFNRALTSSEVAMLGKTLLDNI